MLVGFLGLMSSGYALSLMATQPPEEMVRQNFACPNKQLPVSSFQVLGRVKWQKGTIVLFRALCPTTKEEHPVMQRIFGYRLAQRQGMHWQLNGKGSFGSITPFPEAKKLVEYGIGQPKHKAREPYTIVYGQTLTSKVVAVEATFDNGKLINVSPQNGAFALLAPGASRICELRVIGTDNQILRRDDLTTDRRQNKPKLWSHRCWQTTLQL
jgi:hypothetical protein